MEFDRNRIQEFLKKNGIRMKKMDLAVQALTHPSCSQEENMGYGNNQRLEFLGDAILDFVVGDYLYHRYPAFKEGVLTQVRAGLVCENSLYEIANRMEMGSYILLGRGEELSGGRSRRSTLADAVEALIGAIYLDDGIEQAKAFILRELADRLENLSEDSYADYKSRLQEWVQSRGRENVEYRLLETKGPAHDRWFVSGVYYMEKLLAQGEGKTKKASEQKAAAIALAAFQAKGTEE